VADPAPPHAGGPLRWAGRAIAVVLAGGLVALLIYGVAARSPDTTIDDSLAEGKPTPAPAFTLDVLQRGEPGPRLAAELSGALGDGRLSVAELRGTPFVLNLWASWCDPCREEAPFLERGWRDARRRGVLFLGLDQQDVEEDARAFMRAFDVSYPNVRDPGDDTARSYGATGLPETFFVDARGRIVAHVIGAIVSDDQMSAGIEAAATGRVLGAERGGELKRRRGPEG
jgi:cytochrome c biogenesis protein CcmG, thiol:disulfide interchange protein DsbE